MDEKEYRDASKEALLRASKGFKDIRDATKVENTASVVQIVRSVDRAHELAEQNIEALRPILAELTEFRLQVGPPERGDP